MGLLVAVQNVLQKYFQNFAGLDLRSSDLIRSKNAATSMLNAQLRDTGALSKRSGYKFLVKGDQGSGNIVANGLAVWEDTDVNTGAVTERLVGIGQDLFEKLTDTFTLSYTGTGSATYKLTLNPDNGDFEFVVVEDGVTITTQNLGNGTDVADMNVSTLVTNLNALTDFTCTGASLSGSQKAAFIPTQVEQEVNASVITYSYWSQIDTPSGLTNPFSLHWAKRTDTSFENATFSQLNDVIYISNGYDKMCKFDGLRVYRAGLPQAQISSVTDAGSGATFSIGNKFDYRTVYEYKDAKENIITGQLSGSSTLTKAAADDNSVVAYNLKESAGTVTNDGFNADQAVVNGAQGPVNSITVDTGNPLKVGDFVYIDDSVSGSIVQRKVTASSDTSVTVDGDAVTVANNASISNIKIIVYRTIDYSASGVPGLFYTAKELVNDSSVDTTTFTDSVDDATLQGNIQLVEPIKAHGLPPVCKYMVSWRNQLVLSGNISSVNTVYYSDITSPEYFPPADQSFDVDRPVTGLNAQDSALYVFEREKINAVNGDFGVDEFTVSSATNEGIGAIAHHTIQEVQGKVFFLSRQGVHAISQQGIEDVGSAIDPRFDSRSTYDFKQAVAFNWRAEDKYLLFLPRLNQSGSNPLSANDSTSEIYVFDYFRNAWLQWDNFNFMGGAVDFEDNLHFMRRSTSGTSTPNSELISISTTGTEFDYTDHADSITFEYSSHWETLGEPSVWKKFLRIKVHALDSTLASFEGDAFDLTIQANHNFDPDTVVGEFSIDFSGGAEGWGVGGWGNVPWGEARLKGSKNKLASKKVRSHRIKFSNDILQQNVLISGYELEIVTPYQPAIKE
jgi:hypothetical protein